MNLNKLTRLLAKNSPGILAGLAAVGVVTTAVFSARAHTKAKEEGILDEIKSEDKTVKNAAIARSAVVYAPAILSGALTIVAVFGGQWVNAKRIGVLTAAYTVGEKALQNLEKDVQSFVAKSGLKMEDFDQHRATESVARSLQEGNNSTVVIGKGEVLCHDEWSGRFFPSTMETLRRAENDFNQRLFGDVFMSVNEYYTLIGIDSIGAGDDLGWEPDGMLRLKFGTVLTPEGVPCLSVSFEEPPHLPYR